MSDSQPVEGKVWASTIGAGAGGAVSLFVLWLLGVLIWNAPLAAEAATEAVAAVPAPVSGLILAIITVGSTFISGYITKHSPRPVPVVDEAGEPVDEGALMANEGFGD